MLTREEKEQWKRQIAIPQFGEDAQFRLKKSTVAIFGVGGVGCAAALYLAAAGVGKLILVDKDDVSIENLNRQILYDRGDIGKPKAKVAAERLQRLNPFIGIEILIKNVGTIDIIRIAEKSSFVIDAFDQHKSRLEVDAVCVRRGIVVAHGFAQDLSGEIIVVEPNKTPCLSCVLDENFPELSESSVLGVTAGLIGIQLSTIAIKYLTGCGVVKSGYRLVWDLLLDQFLELPLQRLATCPVCSCVQ
ncbi:MAG: HesA/MoeB/ThiF family protein [Thermacetogeniaceae bacterium]